MKKILLYIFVGFLAWKFFTTAEFVNFANGNSFIRNLFGAKTENGEQGNLPMIKYAPHCHTYLKNYAYDKAIPCFKRELIDDRNNPEIHYYLAFSYYGNKNYQSAIFHTDYIIKNLQNSNYFIQAAALQQRVKTVAAQKEQLETSDTPDYYNEIKKPLHWGRMPINVWIEHSDNNFNLRNAFNTWQTALYPTISFKFVNNPENAHISVIFDDAKKHCTHIENPVGCASYRVYGNDQTRLYDVKIHLSRYDKFHDGKRFSDNQFYAVLCHEIGHALGISGHSKNKSDVMYPSTDNYNTRPTRRDIRTIERIYGK